VIDLFKWCIAAGALIAITGMVAGSCSSSPRANCYTCVERCHPFRVSACEPAWSHLSPLYCSCDPFTRVDETPAVAPAKGK
jgi:hypothetical protein